ncbi:PREDICTED: kirola-like [Ipomoea nil]|uniref:kirola-like n=1 Tax=Ipomoea nil TaxID=35883 RepID=UPI0009017F20|nr:PREDICTED: kirola-like [Ipomoea nil]
MGLKGKVLVQVEISFHGDIYHQLFSERPHHIPSMCKGIIGVEGQWGTVGSIIHWKFSHDGKSKTAEEVIEAIDEKEKLVKFKVIGGEILEDYKSFIIICQVHTNDDNHLVTWTIEYEKLKEEIPEPFSYLEFLLDITKDMEDHHANLKP